MTLATTTLILGPLVAFIAVHMTRRHIFTALILIPSLTACGPNPPDEQERTIEIAEQLESGDTDSGYIVEDWQ